MGIYELIMRAMFHGEIIMGVIIENMGAPAKKFF